MSVALLFTRHRLAKLGGFASAQLLVQAIGFASGIALVHYLDQLQYGYYTLAVSMVGLAGVLLDLGLSAAVLARGGPLHADRKGLGSLMGDASGLQRQLLLAGVLLLIPVISAMFFKQGLPWREVGVLSLLVLSCAALNVQSAVAMSLVRLRGDISTQQKLDVGIGLGKLLLVMAAASLYLDAQIAVVLNLAAAGVLLWVLRRYLAAHLGDTRASTGEHAPALKAFIRKQAPNSIYYCLVGQIAIWLVGLFGSAERVAEVGALGRLAALFTVIGAVINAMVQPYFARATSAQELVSGFIALNGFFALLTLALLALAIAAPVPLLWILGRRYGNLTEELVWMVLATSLSAWAGALYGVGAARSWVVPSVLMIPLGLATLALAVWTLDVSTVKGSFMMNSAVALTALLLTFGMVALRLRAIVVESRAVA